MSNLANNATLLNQQNQLPCVLKPADAHSPGQMVWKRSKILYQSQWGETTVSDWLRCSEQAFWELKGLVTCWRAPWQCYVNVRTPFLDAFHIWVCNFCNTPEIAWLLASCTRNSPPPPPTHHHHWKLFHFLRFCCSFPFCVLYHRL